MTVAEDDGAVRALLAQVLGAELGAGTVVAPDEAEALEWACRVATDVVLLDLVPPPVHGCPVAPELPADRRARSAAIVAISAMTPVELVRTRVLEAGCDDFVARPFRIDVLLDRVHEFLRTTDRYREDRASN